MKFLFTILILPLMFLTLNAKQKGKVEPYSHFLSIYAGPSIIVGDWDFGINAKLNWEMRRESEDLGFGAFAEINSSKFLDFSFGIPIFWHNAFTNNLFFFIAPGLFITKNVDYTPPFMIPEEEEKTQVKLFKNEYRGNFMIKFGVGWDFQLQNNGINFMLISPHLNFNLISEMKIYLNIGVSAVLIIR